MLIIFFIFYFYSQKYNRKEVFNEVPTGTYFLLILILNLFFACLVLKFKKPYYKLTTQKFIFYFIPAFIFSFVIQINRFRLDIQEYEYETLAGFLTPVAVFICAVIFKLRNIQKNWQSTKITRIGIIISCISIPLLILGFIFYIDNGYYYWDKSKSYMNYFDYDYSFGILNLLGIILLFLGLTLFSGIYDRIYKWVKTGE
jgi:hypothetical protein